MITCWHFSQVDAMCIKQLPARATLGFLHSLYAIVLSGSVSTHRLCGATKAVPRTKLVGPHAQA